jgi:hypothetical protein
MARRTVPFKSRVIAWGLDNYQEFLEALDTVRTVQAARAPAAALRPSRRKRKVLSPAAEVAAIINS